MPTCPSPLIPPHLFSLSLSLSHSFPLTHSLTHSSSFSLSLSFSLSFNPSPTVPLLIYLTVSLATLSATRGCNPIHTTLSLPHSSSRNVLSRLNPCDRSLPSSPVASRGFSPSLRTHPRSFPPRHCVSFYLQPSRFLSLFSPVMPMA